MIIGSAAWLQRLRERGPQQFGAAVVEDPNPRPRRPLGVPKPSIAAMQFVGLQCPYCSSPMALPTRDHVVPRSRCGPDTAENVVMACRPCNNDKGNMLVEEWIAALRQAGDVRASIVSAWWLARSPVETVESAAPSNAA